MVGAQPGLTPPAHPDAEQAEPEPHRCRLHPPDMAVAAKGGQEEKGAQQGYSPDGRTDGDHLHRVDFQRLRIGSADAHELTLVE